MKKLMLFAMVASLLFFAGFERKTDSPSGNGLFTVSEGHQVRFASGNLEYDGTNGYSFAAHQYDYGGYFGWGTGSNPTLTFSFVADYPSFFGWETGSNPTLTSSFVADYPSFDDWGNHIAGGWRTLSHEEWEFLLFSRAYAGDRRGAATVCGVHGMVLLPDSWSGGTFHAGFNRWSTNVYDASSWADMEAAGAVFLPAAGGRYGTELRLVGAVGDYWSSTPAYEDYAYGMYFDDEDVGYNGNDYRYIGRSVRLVQDY